MKKINPSDISACLLFAGILLVEVLLIRPFGNFPLNDDWAASLSVYAFVKSGTMYFPALLAAFSIVPILYGIGISALFGFSFIALRMTTVILAWGCACFLYAFLRKNDFSRPVSIAATTLLLASPLFINLSYTFMSDIPALFFLLGAIFFLSIGFKEKRYGAISVGMLFGVLGFFTRQMGIFILISAAVAYFFDKSLDRKKGVLIFGLSGVIILVIVGLLYGSGIRTSAPVALYLSPDVFLRIIRTLSFIIFLFALTGLAMLPAAGSIWIKGKKISGIRLLYQLIFSAGMVLVLGAIGFIFFNQFQNIITLYGIGPAPFVMVGNIRQWGPTAMYVVVTGLAIVSVIYLFRIYANGAGSHFRKRPWNMFVWYYAALYCLFISVVLPFFDRYYILLLPLACYCAAQVLERHSWRPRVFYAILACVGLYGTIGTHNYFAWNDARWRLGENLVASGIPRDQINGGYEWNGRYFYKDGLDGEIRRKMNKDVARRMDAFLFHYSAPYVLSFSPLPDMEIVDELPVTGVFSNIKTIYALRSK